MNFAVDHIVQEVDDLQQVSRAFDALDIRTVVFQNDRSAMAVLHQCTNTYVEYCTPFTNPWRTLAPHRTARKEGEPSRTWVAIRVDDIHACAASLWEQGYMMEGPRYQSVQLPTGEVVESLVLIPRIKSPSGIPLPIFIERGGTEISYMQKHHSVISPDAILNLRSIAIATRDVSAAAETWATLLRRRPTECWIQTDISAYCVRIPLDDNIYIIFCSPVGEGLVARTLREHGDHVFLLNFTGSHYQVDSSICGTVHRMM
ncbi:VOC family protein [Alicyclobacillus acidoterrestris]|uniref:VOC family protein n=1 Tax=Alicyclobacillus acidoterrestris (strain ATCC 49025 / DSM 3922 / CIP 106132 / NCIMB 13137 / GD3B) TaxID=1356854 RepID=A0A9E6ZF85_ALIAG|nr:VOC family protein [Alicyclobacillus acidoterrestris]UNO48780.1 VOC family protein [Alicyclobacillus acidoterrestris]